MRSTWIRNKIKRGTRTDGAEETEQTEEKGGVYAAGIFDGDTAIIRRADRADNGQIVVALVDNEEATLKVLDRKSGNEVWLLPCNKDYEPIKLTADRLKIQGILYGIVRKYN